MEDQPMSQEKRLHLKKYAGWRIHFMIYNSNTTRILPNGSYFQYRILKAVVFEDARFVRFIDDDKSEKILATYTAYNGHVILPKLISTEDFYSFPRNAFAW